MSDGLLAVALEHPFITKPNGVALVTGWLANDPWSVCSDGVTTAWTACQATPSTTWTPQSAPSTIWSPL